MNELINSVLSSLEYVGACLLLLLLLRASDILFGLALSRKCKAPFDCKKLLHGLILTAYAVAGSAALAVGMSMVVPIISFCGLITDEALLETLKTFNVSAMCAALTTIAVTTYGKDAALKFKQFFDKSKADTK